VVLVKIVHQTDVWYDLWHLSYLRFWCFDTIYWVWKLASDLYKKLLWRCTVEQQGTF